MYDADYESYLEELREEIKGQVDGSRPFDKRALKYEVKDSGKRGEPVGGFKRYNPSEGKYEVKDSGKRFESEDGMVRDTSEGKPQFSLMFPKGIPYEDQLMTRVADLYYKGGVKYGERNWEKSNTEQSLAKHEDCLMRHVVKFLLGMEDEDHAAAVVWNVNAVLLTRYKIAHEVENETTAKIDEFLDDPSKGVKKARPRTPMTDEDFIAKTNAAVSVPDAKPFPKVEFKLGDELLDKNNDWWRFKDGLWLWGHNTNHRRSWADLVKDRAPLYIQTGEFAGLTILKDGSKRWG